jgi:predicted alpha/beta superfamily hydrolase
VPDKYAGDSARYPLLLLLDAEEQFRSAVATVRFLASQKVIPDMIVVGVVNGTDRTHDLTPPATGETATAFPTAGGADSLLTFITAELLPWVARNYRTSAVHILAGHSLGGLFVLHAAVAAQSPFDIVIAMSPALWWNDSTVVAYYAERLAGRTAPLSLFVTSGGLEPTIDLPTSHLVALIDSTAHPALVLTYRRYPELGHNLTPLYSLADGLRVAFQALAVPFDSVTAVLSGPVQKDSAAFVAALQTLERRYAAGAVVFNRPPLFPETTLNRFGYMTLEVCSRLAVSMFRTNIERYPHSANAFDSLGDGLLAVQDTVGARLAFRKSVSLAKQKHDSIGAQVTSAKLAALGDTL